MNAGLGHEAGETARGFFDALKSQPALLALSVGQIAMLGFLFYVFKNNSDAWDHNNAQRADLGRSIFEYQREVNKLLAFCSFPEGTQLPPIEPRK